MPHSAYDSPRSTLPYSALATNEEELGEEEGSVRAGPRKHVSLSLNDKLRLVRPLLARYMLPLCKHLPNVSRGGVNNRLCSYSLSRKYSAFFQRMFLTYNTLVRVHHQSGKVIGLRNDRV